MRLTPTMPPSGGDRAASGNVARFWEGFRGGCHGRRSGARADKVLLLPARRGGASAVLGRSEMAGACPTPRWPATKGRQTASGEQRASREPSRRAESRGSYRRAASERRAESRGSERRPSKRPAEGARERPARGEGASARPRERPARGASKRGDACCGGLFGQAKL